MKRSKRNARKNAPVTYIEPWFERVMRARTDPYWVAFAVFFVPSAFLNMAMFIVAVETISRT